MDASSWEIGACGFGNWKQFGHMTVRGSDQDLRGEVNAFLDLEARARVKWAKEMALLERTSTAPSVRLAFARSGGGKTDKLAKLTEAPNVRLAVVKALGRGELMAT